MFSNHGPYSPNVSFYRVLLCPYVSFFVSQPIMRTWLYATATIYNHFLIVTGYTGYTSHIEW